MMKRSASAFITIEYRFCVDAWLRRPSTQKKDAIPKVGSPALSVLSLQPVFVDKGRERVDSFSPIIYEVLLLTYVSVHIRWF
jgi:hypothetical protein